MRLDLVYLPRYLALFKLLDFAISHCYLTPHSALTEVAKWCALYFHSFFLRRLLDIVDSLDVSTEQACKRFVSNPNSKVQVAKRIIRQASVTACCLCQNWLVSKYHMIVRPLVCMRREDQCIQLDWVGVFDVHNFSHMIWVDKFHLSCSKQRCWFALRDWHERSDMTGNVGWVPRYLEIL